MRFRDAANSSLDCQLNVRYPDVIFRDSEPYDVTIVRGHIQLLIEVTSESTFETDPTAEHSQYAAAGIPGYLVVQFDKDWTLEGHIYFHLGDDSAFRAERFNGVV